MKASVKNLPNHFENAAMLSVSAEEIFAYLDDHEHLSAHMGTPSWQMARSRMETVLDAQRGKAVGSQIRLSGLVLGMNLGVDEVVTERNPPRDKAWETIGVPRLLVIGDYRMGFEIRQDGTESLLRVFIDYALPNSVSTRWLGYLFARPYAKWCVRQMLDSAVNRFAHSVRA